jgi:hypothetical protein
MKSSEPKEPKQVLAIEYNGCLYRDLVAAETARARQTLNDLLKPVERGGMGAHFMEMERSHTIDQLLKKPHEAAAVFARVVAAMGDKR